MPKHLLMLAIAATLSACSGNDMAETSAPVSEGPAAIAQKLVADHAGADFKDVLIVSVEEVDFSDSSLGCPQPDMAYLQVITSGQKIVARVGERDYDVRVAGKQGLVCEPQLEQPPGRDSAPQRNPS